MTRVSTQTVAVLLVAFLVAGCSKPTKVNRIAANSTTDISGRWNDTDSRLVAEEMVRDCLNSAWYATYVAKKKTPAVIVGSVKNKSHEHIDAETFTKDMERALTNSGKVEFVASKGERDQLRDELADQAVNASVESQKQRGEEAGADLMLIGTINSIVDQEGGKAVIFYQINLELVQLQTNRKLWIGDKKIKKFVSKKSVKF
jgi:uncharacterized protein (TIGR02722 family)